MLPRLLRRLLRPRAGREEFRGSQLEHFDEAKIIGDIALREATAMKHVPCMVHVLAAVLYRLRDADPLLADRMGVNVRLARQWAVENLPLISPLHQRYEGSLDFEYTFDIVDNGDHRYHLKVKQVHRPVRPMPVSEAPSDKTGRQSKGEVIFREAPEDDPFTVGVMSVLRFVGGNQLPEEPPEPTIVTLQWGVRRLLREWRLPVP